MAEPVIMPRQGQSVETCILGRWHKEIGEKVETGEILFSYETDKSAFDEEAKTDGILLARFFEEGDEVPVLATVAVIGEAGENIDEFGASEISEMAESTDETGETAKVIEFSFDPPAEPVGHIRISPLARNMAAKTGIDISLIEGTGPKGRIIARDIEAARAAKEKPLETELAKPVKQPDLQQPTQPAVAFEGEPYVFKPLSNMRKLIARSMHQSLQNSAQLTHHLSADARRLLASRKYFKQAYESGKMPENITVNDLVCFAVIRALKKFPQVNSHFLGDQMKYFSKVNLGLAVDTDRGLMVPALRHADDYSITGLSTQLRTLAESCRKGAVNPDLLSPEAASFTVSNLGNYGVEMFTPVINLPQSAILGVCTILHRPQDLGDGTIGFVPVIGLSLTYDHRALDGGEATRFLAAVAKEIETLQFDK